MRIGSLFSGYGGLEQGVQSVLGGTVAWHSEIDPGACKILAHRYPDVPNIGDITTVDWSAVEPVDVLTGGFPCQDVSCAGLRKGLRPDTRSGLWTQMAYAIDQLRPALVVAENVRGLLSAEAHSDLEPCPWCVGDGGGVPLRALGAVLGDLADLGYDASWQGLRAADVGAPHGRFRVFVVAWPAADAGVLGRHGGASDRGARRPSTVGGEASDHAGDPGGPLTQDADVAARGERWLAAPGQAEGRGAWSDAGGRDRAPTAHAHGDALREQPVTLAGRGGPAVAGLTGADAPADADGDGLGGLEGAPTGRDALRPDERDDADRCGDGAAADADELGWGPNLAGLREGQSDTDRGATTPRADRPGHGHVGVEWGAYGPAVRRWERLTRLAPAPTEPGAKGQPRLSPAFVEWMQGLPVGWVTDVPGLTRNEQLKALGNGVVPQQAAAALRMLLAAEQRAAA